eukprot:8306637-Pyramimonas_sp.AAC.1
MAQLSYIPAARFGTSFTRFVIPQELCRKSQWRTSPAPPPFIHKRYTCGMQFSVSFLNPANFVLKE